MASGRRLQLVAVAVFFIAYALLSHYSNSHPQARDLGAALALAPMLTIGLALTWRWTGPLQAGLAAAVVAFLVHEYWPLLTRNFPIVSLVQECGFYIIVASGFARSLLPGRVPLCTRLADKIHGPLSALELRYTRAVTIAWVVFFVLSIAVTALLFAFAPLRIWSLFVNFLSLPLIPLMFAAEYAVRRRVLPKGQTSGLIATLRVYFASPR